MQNIRINNLSINIPSTWNDLTKSQLLYIIDLFRLKHEDLEFRIKAAFYFLNIKVSSAGSTFRSPDVLNSMIIGNSKPFYLSNVQILSIADSVSFLTHTYTDKNNNETLSLNSNLTINKIPALKHKGIYYFGAGDNLFNITFDEYLEADAHFLNFINSNNDSDLNKLIASLYRPVRKKYKYNSPDSTGDKRQPFNSNLIDHYAANLASLNTTAKIAVSLFYNGCRQFLSNNFKNVFNDNNSSSSGTGNQFGSLSLIDALTNDDVTKNDLVRKSLLYDVLVRLERASVLNKKTIEDAEKLKRK